MTTLVIVESPTKARTIRNFLPANYRVEASMGHIRDLPQTAADIPEAVKKETWAQLGVNVEADFEPLYIVPKDKKKIVKTLQDALKDSDELLLATDEDREGESISWHLTQVLKPKVPIKRMVFHEITQEAIQEALRKCRTIDVQLVHAQETRRILDRLVGYTLSPLLWKKIAWGLSAGRVQSVAVRLLVQRERERRAFKTGSYWDLKAQLEHEKARFESKLVSLQGKRVATGADFDENTGRLRVDRDVTLLNEEEARSLQARLLGQPWQVAQIEERPVTRKPSPPFTTSTLQQESNRKLHLSAKDTMRAAQSLYEQGYITYMRTDSVHLSQQAITAARDCVSSMYGAQYLSPEPRQYTTKSKGAQEAHEAIRPAGQTYRTPQQTGLSGREFQLYDLIWKRTVACQMAEARLTYISAQIQVADAMFRSSGKRIDFHGFFRAYVEGSDDPDAALDDQEVTLPPLKVSDRPVCKTLEALGHETQPPARFTEASLVKTLESEGIGRPSTYATIIGTIIERSYAQMLGNALAPTFTAFSVTALLEQHFPDLVNTSFTAKMERTLDEISMGQAEWLPYLRNFYQGEQGLEKQTELQSTLIDPNEARAVVLTANGESDLPFKVRIGRYGPYVEFDRDGESFKASIPKDLTPADLSMEQVEIFLRQKIEGPDKVGIHPETDEPIYLLFGNYGPYLQLGDATEEKPKPKRASLPKGTDPETITLESAVGLLSLPRLLGAHPESGCRVQAGLGPYGAYVVHDQGKVGKDYRSLKKEDDVLGITLERAIELLAQPKLGRGGRGQAAKPLKDLGVHPADESPVTLHKGPYGLYVKHEKTNASLQEGQTEENITLAIALELLAAKASTKKTTTKKTGAKKTTTKSASTPKKRTTKASAADKTTTAKTTAKKTTAKKTTAKKTTAKKTSPKSG